jgi:hypothetical protein
LPDRQNDAARDLSLLEAELKRLEAEYNMFFAGRLPRPPWETRARVDALVKRIDRARLTNYGDRFRFTTLQSRFTTFVGLWDRGLRAREEGRQGTFAQAQRPADPASRKPDKVMHVTTFSDPAREADKLQHLYESLAEARREAGQEPIPYHKFADLIRTQVAGLREKGSPEVAFRVALKDGKVNFTARALRGGKK